MTQGNNKTRENPSCVLVDFGSFSRSVDEQTYPKMNYLPEFDLLPWCPDFDPSILIIDVMPDRPRRLLA